MTDGEPETVVSVSLQKIKSINNLLKLFFKHFLNLIKSETSDSFVSHFDGHFAYLKTLDFSFKKMREGHQRSDEHWNCFKGNVTETSERWAFPSTQIPC